ncbi:MAG: hypothetical protein IKG40_00395 [Bacilli bacterium]|nr:hypothetical protein [Bacilli bacterium]
MASENKIIYSINNKFVTNEPIENINLNKLDSVILYEYIGLFYNMNDVIKKTNLITKKTTYIVQKNKYALYHYELNYPDSPYPWEIVKGNLRHIYEEFIKEGVKLYTKKYDKKESKLKLLKITSHKD